MASHAPVVRALRRGELSPLLAGLAREVALVLLSLYLAFGLAVGGPLSNDLWLDGAHVTALQHVAHESFTQDGHVRHHGERSHVALALDLRPVMVDFTAQLHGFVGGLPWTVDPGHLGLALLIVLASLQRLGWQRNVAPSPVPSRLSAPPKEPPRLLRLAPTP
jgi:hypothetical protein